MSTAATLTLQVIKSLQALQQAGIQDNCIHVYTGKHGECYKCGAKVNF